MKGKYVFQQFGSLVRTGLLIWLITFSHTCLGQEEKAKSNSLERAKISEFALADIWVCDIPPEASFPGGSKAWQQYLEANLKWPSLQESVEGRIFMFFHVDTLGNVDSVKLIRGLHPKLDEEAMRFLSNSPKWNPAIDYRTGQAIVWRGGISLRYPTPRKSR